MRYGNAESRGDRSRRRYPRTFHELSINAKISSGSGKIFQYFRLRPRTLARLEIFPIPGVSPDMKILLILNPPCVQRFALTAIASSGSVATISKHMHPFGVESITKPLKAIARRARWDYRAPENLSIIREGRDEQRERERESEKEKDPSVRAKSGRHTLTATTEIGLKWRNYSRGLYVRASSRGGAPRNCPATQCAPIRMQGATEVLLLHRRKDRRINGMSRFRRLEVLSDYSARRVNIELFLLLLTP